MQQTKTKKLNKIILFILLALLLPCFLLLGGCSEVYVSTIEYTGVNGNTVIYTVKYSDGKTSTITVENGKDADITLRDIFEACVDAGIYSNNNEENYKEFLKAYITTNVEEEVTSTQFSIYSALNSTVSIYTAFQVQDYYETLNRYGLSVPHQYTGYEIYTGSGVVYKIQGDDAYIITNCHVVTCYTSTKANKLPVEIMLYPYGYENETYYLSDSKVVWGDVDEGEYYYTDYEFSGGITCVSYSVDHDLALLKVKTADLLAMNKDAAEVTFAKDYNLLDEVYAIGNPSGFGISVTKGIVSVASEEIDIDEIPADNKTHYYRVMRIDNAVYGGNSGGGLFNTKGELVGIVNAGSNSGDNWSYALPIDMVEPCVENLLENGVRYSVKAFTMKDLGAELTDVYSDFDELTGKLTYEATVAKVGGVLANCSMKVGDVITSVTLDDKEYTITAAHQIDDVLLRARTNSKLTFKVTRGTTENIAINVSTTQVNGLLK